MPARVKPEDYVQPPQPERSLDVPVPAPVEEAPAPSAKKGKK